MDNQVNYRPFSALGSGDIFSMLDRTGVMVMKSGSMQGTLLDGYWDGDHLVPRGTIIPFGKAECVILVTEGNLSLPMAKVDPIDPRRRFWKDGDQAYVGDHKRVPVNVFAGLFLYAGMGSGTYYSGVENEVFHMQKSDARAKAQAENLPFVHHDSMRWTNDPTLADERKQAQEAFERTKSEQAEGQMATEAA